MLKIRTNVPKLSRKERDEIRHRKDILDAAERVFARKGFHSATIADVAAEAEFGIGTIYKFFKNKDELFIRFIAEKIGGLVESTKAAADKAFNPKGKIEACVTTQLKFFYDNRELHRIFTVEAPLFEETIGGRLGVELREKIAEHVNFFEGIVSDGISAGIFRPVKHMAATHAVMGIIYMAVQHWSIFEPDSDLLSWKDSILEVIFNGILA